MYSFVLYLFTRASYLVFAERYPGRMSSNVAGSIADSLPALLLIHGDSYSWGAGNSFDGTALAAHGRLIVVSINFRLGVLGKLSNTYSKPSISFRRIGTQDTPCDCLRLFDCARVYCNRLRENEAEYLLKKSSLLALSQDENKKKKIKKFSLRRNL